MVSIRTLLGRVSSWRGATAAVIATTILCAGLVTAPPALAAHASRPSPYFRQLANIGPNGGHNFLDPGFKLTDGNAKLHFFLTPDFGDGDKWSRCPTNENMELRSYIQWFGPDGAMGAPAMSDYRYAWSLNSWCGGGWTADSQIEGYGLAQPAGANELRFYFVYDNIMDGVMNGPSDANEVLVAEARTVAPPPAPDAPSDLALVSVQRDAAELNWQDNATTETSQQLQRSDDGRSSWATVATLPADQTTYTDGGLTPGHTYWYRIRSSNTHGDSAWSNELEVTPGCESDTDCDGLSNSDETNHLHTDPNKPDTDGDGLLDPWESPARVGTEEIENSGFRSITIPELGEGVASRDDVFRPFGTGPCPEPDGNLRWAAEESCMNGVPDPLQKDAYLELDWQDCHTGEGCPHGDPMHHAPDKEALEMVRQKFATAGVDLHILIDEAVAHQPNCDQDAAGLRSSNFGTSQQRDLNPAVLAAKELAVRYVWSGHSSADPAVHDGCQTPRLDAMIATAFGYRSIENYDWSPFGDANLGGRDILITLGPLWSCDERVKPVTGMGTVVNADCYRDEALKAGIYPASVDITGQADEFDLPWPIARMLGLPESDGITQLWARTLMHLLGHSMGLLESQVNNQPDIPARDDNQDGVVDPLGVDAYDDWSSLLLAPVGEGSPMTESYPGYEFLAQRDSDGDGVPEGADNCPGIYNPGQEDSDFVQGDRKMGDHCDWDADGDGLPIIAMGTGTAVDPFPYDTDNDGTDNAGDIDDDGDLVLDSVDVCPLTVDPLQADLDGDGLGDLCDIDANGNSIPDPLD